MTTNSVYIEGPKEIWFKVEFSKRCDISNSSDDDEVGEPPPAERRRGVSQLEGHTSSVTSAQTLMEINKGGIVTIAFCLHLPFTKIYETNYNQNSRQDLSVTWYRHETEERSPQNNVVTFNVERGCHWELSSDWAELEQMAQHRNKWKSSILSAPAEGCRM